MARILFLLCALSLISCDREVGEVPPPPDVRFSDTELIEFAHAIEDEFNGGPLHAPGIPFDHRAFFERVAWPTASSESRVDDFLRLVSSIAKADSAGAMLLEPLQNTGQISFLRVVRDNDGTRLLYRLAKSENAFFNYLEALVGKGKDGTPALIDLFNLRNGEYLSQIVRRMQYDGGSGLLDSLVDPGNDEERKAIKAAHAMHEKMKGEDYEEVLNYFEGLPDVVRRNRYVLRLCVQAAKRVENTQRYTAAIEEFKKLYPDDSSLDFYLVDYYNTLRRYNDVLAAYDRLYLRFHDPYIDYQRALTYLNMGEAERAVELAEGVIRWDTTFTEPYHLLLAAANKGKDNRTISRTLERMVRNGMVILNFEKLESDASLGDFVRSDEYAVLKRKYPMGFVGVEEFYAPGE